MEIHHSLVPTDSTGTKTPRAAISAFKAAYSSGDNGGKT
jgi:hypothetical protein